MNALPLLGLGACGFALVLTPLVRDLVSRWGWFDRPDNGRKVHSRPVPRVGGVPVLLACGIAFGIFLLSRAAESRVAAHIAPFAWKLVPAVLVIFVTGLVDDLLGLRPWQKLASQFLAAGSACWAGLGFAGFAGYALPSWLAVPLTLLWLAACANAFNLIDGLDGLAAGAALIAALTMLAASLMLGHPGLAVVSATLAGSLLGFLCYNFHSASIFLGDCGSLTLGFLLGCCAIVWTNEGATIGAAAAPALALSVPLIDTTLAVVRRALRRRPLFGPDRNHIHHRLLAQGWSPRRVVLVLHAACALAAVLSVAMSVAGYPWTVVLAVLYSLAVWLGVQRLGYVELRVAGRLVGPTRLLRAASAEIRLRSLEEALARSESLDQCWDAICDACRDLGFACASMRIEGELREAWLRHAGPCAVSWSLRVPLTENGWISIAGGADSTVEPSVVTPLAIVIRRAIEARLEPVSGEVADSVSDLDRARIPATAVRVA